MGAKSLLAAVTVVMVPVGAANAQSLAAAPVVSPAATAPESFVMPAGTAITVVMEKDLSTATSAVGEQFPVTVVDDVVASGIVVIPKGTTGYGEVSFLSRNRAWGAAGILGITLRSLDLNGKSILLDGHYRQEGKSADAAAAATMFAVGIFAAFVKGKVSIIPKGRMLKARTGQDIAYSAAASQPASATAQPATSQSPVLETK